MLLRKHQGNAIDSIRRLKINAVWVDDDNFLFERTAPIFTEMFRFSGQHFKIEIFPIPNPALNRIKICPPDIILLNLTIPHLDGITLIKLIREFNKDIPIVVVAARNHPDDIAACKDAGADAYHYKGDLTTIVGIQMLQLNIDNLTSQNVMGALQ